MAINFVNNPKVGDNVKIEIGDSSDLQIYHDATNSYVKTTSGNLIIQNELNDADIVFKAYNSAGSLATYFDIDGSAGVTKFRIDTRHLDDVKANFGQGSDLTIFHDGSNSYIKTASNSTGDLFITSQGTNHDLYLQAADDIYLRPQGTENGVVIVGNGDVTLYYDNVAKLSTTSTGVSVTGGITATDNSYQMLLIDTSTSNRGEISVEDAAFGFYADRAEATADSSFFWSIDNLNKMEINLLGGGEGQLRLNDYGPGNITGTAEFILGVDANGNVIETSAGGSGTVTGTGAATRVAFWSGTTALSSDANLYWDNGNDRLGIGTTSPDKKLHVVGSNVTGAFYDTSSVGVFESNNPYVQIIGSDAGNQASSLMLTTVPAAGSGNNKHWALQHRGTTQSGNFGISYDTTSASGQDGADGTDKFVIDTSGKVGIGTTSPNFKTHLYDSGNTVLGITAGLDNYAALQFGRTSDTTRGAIEYYTGDDSLRLKTGNNAEKMRIDSAGNVGIGVVAPASKLHLSFALDNDGLRIENSSRGHNYLLTTAQTNAEHFSIYDVDNSANLMQIGYSQARIYTENTERMRIDSAGEVKIINSSSTTAGPTLKFDAAAKTTWDIGDIIGEVDFFTSDTSGNAPYSAGFIQVQNDTNAGTLPSGRLVFGTATYNSAGGAVERMRIDSAGQISMTKTGADYNLVITNNTAGGDFIKCVAETGDTVFSLDSDGTGGEAALRMYSDGVLKNYINANGSSYFNGGNVGIDNTSPTAKLQVGPGTSNSVRSTVASLGAATNGVLSALSLVNTSGNNVAGYGTSIDFHLAENYSPTGQVATVAENTTVLSALTFSTYSTALNERMRIKSTGKIRFNAYGQEDFTGTAAYLLAVEADGDIIEIGASDLPGGPYLPLAGGTMNSGAEISFDANNSLGISFVKSGGSLNLIIDSNNNSTTANFIIEKDTQTAGSGTELFRVQENGNVGIGVTNPGNKLNIDSSYTNSVLINGTGSRNLYSYHDSGGVGWATGSGASYTNLIYMDSSNNIRTFTNGSERMRITSAGNVGIGTTSPQSKLQVGGTSTSDGSINIGGIYGVYNWTRSYVASNTLIPAILNQAGNALANGGAYRVTAHISGTGTDQSSRAVFWNQNGTWHCNVTAQSGDSSNQIQFLISSSVPSVKTYHASNYTIRVWHERIELAEESGTDNTRHYFGADSYMSQMGNDISMAGPLNGTQGNSGSVGIGTTSPNGKLDVTGDIWLNGDNENAARYLRINRAQSQDGGILLYGNSTLDWQIVNLASTRDLNFYSYAATDSVVRIKASNGYVGIGTTSPNGKLTISGGGTSTAPTISVINTSSLTFNHTINAFAPNLTSGESNILIFGRAGSTKNSAYIGYRYSGTAGSNDNLLILGHWASDNLMTISGDGKVGIGTGTTTPASSLHVVANDSTIAQFASSGSLANDKVLQIQSGGDRVILDFKTNSTGAAAALAFESGNTERMRITSAGDVGIGTTSPNTKLEVISAIPSGNRTVPLDILTITGEGPSVLPYTGSGGAIVFKNTTYNYGLLKSARIRSYVDADSASNRGAGLVFEVTNSNQTYNPSLFLKYNGNVGIGTTSPDRILHIESDTTAAIQLENTSEADSFIDFKNPSRTFRVGYDDSTDLFKIAVTNFNDNSLVVNSSGNVGIGETTPLVPLHISRDSASGENIALLLDNNNTTAGNEIGILFRSAAGSTNTDFEIFGKANGANDMDLVFQSDGSSERMRITSTGDVGIGTTSPDSKLEVENNQNSGFYSVFVKNPNAGGNAFVSKKWLNNDAGFGEIWRNSSTRSSAGQAANSFNLYNSNDINIWSGNSHTMALVGNNVGIGTTAPENRLHLGPNSGNVKLALEWSDSNTATSGEAYSTIYTSGQGGSYPFSGRGNLILQPRNTDANGAGDLVVMTGATATPKLTVQATGNVGIGTTAPAYKLDVSGGAIAIRGHAPGNSLRFDSTDGTTSTSRNALYVDTSNVFQIGNTNYSHNNITGGTYIYRAGDELLRLSTTGATGSPYISFYQSTTRRSYIQSSDTAAGDNLDIASEYGNVRIMTGTNGTETEKMVIQADGDVGIGVTNPVNKLQVGGKIYSSGDIQANSELRGATLRLPNGGTSTASEFSEMQGFIDINVNGTVYVIPYYEKQ